jgi:hypothetical protein
MSINSAGTCIGAPGLKKTPKSLLEESQGMQVPWRREWAIELHFHIALTELLRAF